jgi:O-antigen/teichoic acid export membrane protein
VIVQLTSEPTRNNVIYSVAEYISQPLMMFAAAPVLLHALGTSNYGVWMLANSVAATVSGLGGGFGDAATRYISHYEGRSDSEGAVRALAAAFIVNFSLGLLLATAMAASAPVVIEHVFRISSNLRGQAIAAVRVSAVLLHLRFCEVVFSSAIRALQRYRPSVMVSVSARVATIAIAVYLALRGAGLTNILVSAAAVACFSLIAHVLVAAHLFAFRCEWLYPIHIELHRVMHFGTFTWMKSVLGVTFSHADRLLIAGMLGVAPLSHYVLCTQITQPIHSLVASGLNFLFPAISTRVAAGNTAGARRLYRNAVLASVCIVVALSLPLLLFGHTLLTFWLGPYQVQRDYRVFTLMVAANGLLSASIVPHYAALALGRARALALLNFVSGTTSLLVAVPLLRTLGVLGGGCIRCLAALVSLAAFDIVRRAFSSTDEPSTPPSQTFTTHARAMRLGMHEN